MPLINFKLFSLQQTLLSESSQAEVYLNWYRLTGGYYWLEVGDQCLLKYNQVACLNTQQLPDSLPYVDYHLAQFYQDLDDVLGYVLSPIPIDIYQTIATKSGMLSFLAKQEAWLENAPSEGNEKPIWDTYMLASFISQRKLDLGYLGAAPNIWFLGLEKEVIVRWDNKQRRANGENRWTSTQGEYRISIGEFIGEVIDFLDRLAQQMSFKVDEFCRNDSLPGVTLDRRLLMNEHYQHRLPHFEEIKMRLHNREYHHENWDAVRNAIRMIEENKY